MWRALAAIGESLSDDVRVVVVRGAGPAFSAGLDRRMLDPATAGEETVAELLAMDDATASATIDDFQRGFTWLRDPRFVSIAAVQGYAIGAGFQLALSCDIRVLADDAQLCMKESALGLVPDLTGTKPLVESVGYARALEICATARMVGAAEAVDIGLALAAVPAAELEGTVADLVAALTAALPGAVRETKALLLGAALPRPRRPASARAGGPGPTVPGARRVRTMKGAGRCHPCIPAAPPGATSAPTGASSTTGSRARRSVVCSASRARTAS